MSDTEPIGNQDRYERPETLDVNDPDSYRKMLLHLKYAWADFGNERLEDAVTRQSTHDVAAASVYERLSLNKHRAVWFHDVLNTVDQIRESYILDTEKNQHINDRLTILFKRIEQKNMHEHNLDEGDVQEVESLLNEALEWMDKVVTHQRKEAA